MSIIVNDKFLRDWKKIREKLISLQKEEEIYRKKAEKEMNSNRKNNIEGKNYIAVRRKIKREIIKRKNIPEKVWDKYSEDIVYFTYNVLKK